MKRFLTFLLGIGTMVAGALSASAQVVDAQGDAVVAIEKEFQAKAKVAPATQSGNFIVEQSPSLKLGKPSNVLLAEKPAKKPMKARAKSAQKVSAANLNGWYVGTYSTLTTSSFDGGSTMQIVPDAEGDSITIKNFWDGYSVRAHVDPATNVISIPSQLLVTDEELGPIYFALCQTSGKPDYKTNVTGKVTADGIDFSSAWWGAFVTTGKYKDLFLGAYTNLTILPPNATLTYTRQNSDGTKVDVGYYVIVEQVNGNTLKVTNIFNHGLDVTMVLNRNRTAEMSDQVGMINTNGSWQIIKCNAFNDTGGLTNYSPVVVTDPAADDNNTVISWTEWSLLSVEAKLFAGRLINTKLTVDTPIEYPVLKESGFEGEGTEASPYLIKNRDHLILLSDLVNGNTTVTDGEYLGNPIYTLYKGKYFALANDIDLENYRLDPIGIDVLHRFGGSLDGKGHTLKNVYVDAASKSFGGLFAVCDTVSVIKNLTIENLKSNSDYYYGGGLVCYMFGSLDNIHIVNPEITSARSVAGAIAGIAMGPVTNCTVREGSVTSPMYVGGAVGEAHGGLDNIEVYGTKVIISGSYSNVGGVVGNLICDGNKLAFSGLVQYAYGAVEQQFMGGIAGNFRQGTLSNSYSGGVVMGYSNKSYVGGLVGYCCGNVIDCYSSGLVHCYSREAGGLIGYLQKYSTYPDPIVRNCYTSANTECETYQYDRNNFNEVIGGVEANTNPVLENIYGNRQITNFYSNRFASDTEELTAAQGPAGFSSENWVFTKDAYPRVKGMEDTRSAQYTASAVNFAKKDNVKRVSQNTPVTALGDTKFFFYVGGKLTTQGHYASIKDNKMIEIGTEFGTDTLYIVNGTVQTYMKLAIAPIPFEGDGTVESPFLMKNKADMIALSEATTTKSQTFDGIYFLQTQDIDMELDTAFKGIAATNVTANAFNGVFDGGGYTIDNMTIPDRLVWTTPIQDGKPGTLNASACKGVSGLFGCLGVNGIVRNVTIGAGSKLEMYAQCAAIVGQSNGLVENCKNYADVIGYSCWVGGIVGQTNKGAIIRNCYNAGNITTSYANAGGIVGAATSSTVENCVNTGNISAVNLTTNYAKQLQRVGGISGGSTSGSCYRNCVNFGTVKAELNNSGGLVAALETTSSGISEIYTSMNFGNVYCGNPATIGAITGVQTNPTSENNYYDVQNIGLKAGQNADMTGVTPATTAFLTSGKAIDGFDAELWDFTAGLYPVLKLYANEDKVKAARKVYVSMPEDYTVANYVTTGELSDGATWKLASGTIFKIEGTKLVGPTAVEDVVTDTLYATNSCGVIRPILLTAKPVLNLSGAGTEANPYLVNNVADWTTLCSYIDKTADDLQGNFITVTADLDFNNAAPARLGANGVTAFSGVLDGGNHAFKNVVLTPKANSDCAIIGTVSEDAAIKNFVFEGKVNAAYTFACPVVDKLYGTIENVESKAVITTTKASVGGVVGNAYAGAKFKKVVFSGSIESNVTGIGGIVCTTVAAGRVSFEDCAFTGKIKNTKAAETAINARAIGGLVSSCGSADFTNCYSDGEIDIVNPAFAGTIAGLVATATGNKDYPLYTFTNCYNLTPITAGGKIAGLVSAVSTTAANVKMIFTDCYNAGDISAKSTKALSSAPTAGITTLYTPGSKFINCHNEGTITSDFNVYAAGIAGSNQGTAGAASTPDSVFLTNCWNEGLIIADGNQGGGLLGNATGAVIMTNCYNTGDVEGNQMVGGIVSAFAGTGPQMINCYNTGNVTGKLGRVAGLIAWGSPTNGLVQGCWNAGNVTSTSTADKVTSAANGAWALGGLAGNCSATFKDCYNAGDVKGFARVGGLVGEPAKDKTSLENCYNAGKVIANADSCGYIVGVNVVDNGKVWTVNNKVKNCYFIAGDASNLSVPEGATALTVKELAGKKISDAYTLVDNYSFPVLAGYEENKTAVFYAAQVIPADGNELDNITGDFHVGGASLLTWTSTCPALQFSGSDAKFTSPFSGEFKVTATNGDLAKTYDLKASGVSGVDEIGVSEAISVRYFTPAGIEVKEPVAGEIYIAVSKYADGTTKTQKVTYVK